MGTTSKKPKINLLEMHDNVTNGCIDDSLKISAIQKGVQFHIQNFQSKNTSFLFCYSCICRCNNS